MSDVTRCHTYDTTNARVRRSVQYMYKCGCMAAPLIPFGPKRHAKVTLGGAKYRCRMCKQHVQFTGEVR